MKVSFARQVKEEVVFNDFDICCQKAILSAIIKVNGTLSLSNQGLLLTIRTENAKIASKVHKMLKEVYHPHIEFLVSRKMKLQKNNVYILKVSKAREILDDLGLMNGLGFHTLPDKKIIQKECCKRAFLAGIFFVAQTHGEKPIAAMRLAFLFWAGRWFFLRLGAKETFLWRLFEKKKKCCCKKGSSPVLLWQKGVVGMREPKQYLFLLACLGVCVFALLLGLLTGCG